LELRYLAIDEDVNDVGLLDKTLHTTPTTFPVPDVFQALPPLPEDDDASILKLLQPPDCVGKFNTTVGINGVIGDLTLTDNKPAASFLLQSEPTIQDALIRSGIKVIEDPGSKYFIGYGCIVPNDICTADVLINEHDAVIALTNVKRLEHDQEDVVIPARSVATLNNTITDAPESVNIASVILGAGNGDLVDNTRAIAVVGLYAFCVS